MRRLSLLFTTLVLAACGSTSVDAPPPATTTEEAELPAVELPPSYVSAPIVFDLRPFLADLEGTIPKKFGSVEKEKRIKVNEGPSVWVAPELERGPLEFSFKGNTVTVATVFQYRAKVWAKALLAEHSVSCGIEGDRPRIKLRATVAYDIAPDWTLRTTSHLDELAPMSATERDQCEISFAKINVTGKVADAAKGALEGALKKVDQKLTRVSLQKPIGGIWRTLQRPISISKGMLWLQIQPQAISLSGITADDSSLTARISLLASPRMVSGDRPPDGADPLPALGRGAGGSDTALVYLEGVLVYEAANQILNKALVGKSFKVGWRSVKIENITAMPGGKGRLVLAVTLRGKARGTVYVIGTPSYDPVTDLITLPDVGFDVNTTTAVGKTVGWLIQGPLLGLIQENAKIPAADLLAKALEIANKEINRTLSDGIFLRGSFSGANTRAVQATSVGLIARAQASGRLWVEISKEDLLPGPKKAAPKQTAK